MLETDKYKFKQFWRRVGKLSIKKDIFFNASAITFNIFICAVPFTLILISILGYILSIDAAFEELIRYGRELFPSFSFETQSGDILEGAVTLESFIMPLVGARRVFGIAGILILMVFAQGLFHSLKHVLFDIYDVADRRHPVMELVYNFFAFGVVGGVFIFFSMAISILSLFSFDDFTIPYTEVVIEMGWLPELLTNVIPVIFTFLLFYAIYRYISERRMTAKVAALAAIGYTLLFEIAKFGLGVYLEYALTSYRYFYQGYTILVILGIWIFYSAALFVFISILARVYQEIYLNQTSKLEQNPYTAIS